MAEEIEEFDQERIDALIMKHIGKKPVSEIARMAGIRPEKVMSRKNEMMNEIDVLTIEQKRQKLMIQLDEMVQKAMDKAESISSEFYAGTINAAVGGIKTILVELNRQSKDSSGQLEQLNALRLKEIMRLIDEVVKVSVQEIADEHSLDEDELMEVFQKNLVVAAERIEG